MLKQDYSMVWKELLLDRKTVFDLAVIKKFFIEKTELLKGRALCSLSSI